MPSQPNESISCPSCGKRLRWRAELAGRKVKCVCGMSFPMPAAANGDPAPPPQEVKSESNPFELEEPPHFAESSEPDARSEAALGALPLDLNDAHSPAASGTCPACHAPMKVEAVLCIRCGYNRKSGRKLQTSAVLATTPPASEDDAHHDPDDDAQLGSEGRPNTSSRPRRRTTDDETNYKFIDLYVPVAMIAVGILFTILRAYGGMGALNEEEDAAIAKPVPRNNFFGRPSVDEGDPSEIPASEMEETIVDQDSIKGNPEADQLLEILKQPKAPPADPQAPAEKDKAATAPLPPPEPAPTDIEKSKTAEREAAKAKRKLVASRSSLALAAVKKKKGFSVSPLILAFYSLAFQAIVMVPIILFCCMVAAKVLDIGFGSLQTTLLKLTGLVIGPMAICDWINDTIMSATLGTGMMLTWFVRIVVVGLPLAKLFDLNFWEVTMLLIVILVVQFFLALILMMTVASFFVI